MGKAPIKKNAVTRKGGPEHAETSSYCGQKRLFAGTITQIVLIVTIGFLAYSNTFDAPFQWDEKEFIVHNPIIKHLHYFLDLSAAKGFKLYQGSDLYSVIKARYIGYLTFAVNYKINGLNVRGYHVVNLLIHLFNALLVLFLAQLTFRTPFLRNSEIRKYSCLISLFSALFFVSHPIQTEAVTYIFQRFASLVTMFYLLSIVTYIKARLETGKGKALFFTLSFFSALVAMKTKENAFTLPIMIALYEFLFFSGPIRTRLFLLIPLLLTLSIIPFTLTGTEKTVGAPSSWGYTSISGHDYLLTQFPVMLTYLRLLFFPAGQNIDHDFPVYTSFFSVSVIASFLFILIVFGSSLYLIRRSRSGDHALRIIGFGILWFFISISVESSIIPIPMVICEYRVYLPSFGVFIAVTTALFLLSSRLRTKIPKMEEVIIAVFFGLILITSATTYARNILWGNEISLWDDTAKKSPNKASVHHTLAFVYLTHNRLDDAIKEFETVLMLNPGDTDAHNDLGKIYFDQGNIEKAAYEFQTVLKVKPDDAYAHNNLGYIYLKKNLTDAALKELQAAVALKPDFDDAHNNLGNVYVRLGNLNGALKEYQIAFSINPDNANAKNNLKMLHDFIRAREK